MNVTKVIKMEFYKCKMLQKETISLASSTLYTKGKQQFSNTSLPPRMIIENYLIFNVSVERSLIQNWRFLFARDY